MTTSQFQTIVELLSQQGRQIQDLRTEMKELRAKMRDGFAAQKVINNQLRTEMQQGFATQQSISDEILNAIGTELQEFYKKTEREHHQFNKRLTKLEKRLA